MLNLNPLSTTHQKNENPSHFSDFISNSISVYDGLRNKNQ